MARRLRIEPYDPNAVDGDGDGIVQENTAWERPVGTRLIDEFGNEIRQGFMSTQRPARMRVIDRNGNDVRYTPTYQTPRERQVTQTPLGSIGAPSLTETGATPIPTLADRGLQTIGERLDDIDAIVNPQTAEAPDDIEPIIPEPRFLKSLESSTPDVDPDDVRNSILFGSLMMITAKSDQKLLDLLRNDWDRSTRDYFEYWTDTTINFDEYRKLVEYLDVGFELPQLTRKDGSPLEPETLSHALRLASAAQVSKASGVRERLKQRVSEGIADHMTREPLQENVRKSLINLLRNTEDVSIYGRSLTVRTQDYAPNLDLGGRSFSDGSVRLSEEQIVSLYDWALGGDRPLWLDSPDTPEEYRIIFGSGLQISKRYSDDDDDLIAPRPINLMRVFPSDSPEVIEAKYRARKFYEDGLIQPPGLSRTPLFFRQLVENLQKDRLSHASNRVAEEKAKEFFDWYYDTEASYANKEMVSDIIDSRDSPNNKFRYQTPEQRLFILAGSGFLTDEQMAKLKEIVGWDFTQQPGWEEFSKQMSITNSFSAYKKIVEGKYGKHLSIIDKTAIDKYVYMDGSPIPVELSQTTKSALSNLGDASYEAFSGDGLERVLSAITILQDKLDDDAEKLSPGEIDELVRNIHKELSLESAYFQDMFLLVEIDAVIESLADPADLTDEDKFSLLQDRPAYEVLKGISSKYVRQWAMTSNGEDPHSYALQAIAQEIFDLDETLVVSMEDVYSSRQRGLTGLEMKTQMDEVIKLEGDLMRLFMRAQYANTQEFLASMDLQSIPIARAMNLLPGDLVIDVLRDFPDDSPDIPSVDAIIPLRPLSAFGNYLPGMSLFAKDDPESVVIFTRVPAHQIIGTPFSGMGCFNEYEIVVLGKPLYGRVIQSRQLRRENLFDPPSVGELE
jgi:hypothetical protein